jgi:dolichol-phosphate mannosyltransferase
MESPRVSIAIPLFNEEQGVEELLRRVRAVVDRLPGGPHELVLVDDGSSDRTFQLIAAAATEESNVIAISLSRNFGHQSALSAALDHVTGDVVVVMDGDLQDAPEVIPEFIHRYKQGFDVVYAQRSVRREGWLLRFCYFVYYRFLASLSDTRLPLDAGDFALISRRVVDELKRLPEHHRYLRGLRAWVGFRQTGVEVERAERIAGMSKYSFRKLLSLAFDGIFAFSVVPLRLSTIMGTLTILASLLFAVYSLYVKFVLDRSPEGFTALILVIVFVSGVQLLFLGMIGEYVGRVYEETKGRPNYIISRIIRRN